MKKLLQVAGLACLLFLNACSKKEDTTTGSTDDDNTFALWVQVGSWPNANYYIMGMNSLTEGTATLSGNGVDVTSILNNSVIKHDGYYYYYNTTEGRFGKYQIKNGAVSTVKEIAFTNIASLAGHTWINDNTLVLVGLKSGGSEIRYSVIDVSTMTATNGAIAGVPAIPEGYATYRVGGDIQYVNGNLFFAITYVNSAYVAYPGFTELQVAYSNFTVGSTSSSSLTSGVGNTSGYYATSFVDKNSDMYWLSSWVAYWGDGSAYAPIYIFRIKSGSTTIDESYHVNVKSTVGYEAASGLFMDLGNGTAILKYIVATTNGESTYGYTIINLSTGTEVRKLTEIPTGAAGERNVLVENGKAYIAVLSGTSTDYIWIYDAASDTVTKGTAISGGYNSFSRLERLN